MDLLRARACLGLWTARFRAFQQLLITYIMLICGSDRRFQSSTLGALCQVHVGVPRATRHCQVLDLCLHVDRLQGQHLLSFRVVLRFQNRLLHLLSFLVLLNDLLPSDTKRILMLVAVIVIIVVTTRRQLYYRRRVWQTFPLILDFFAFNMVLMLLRASISRI